MARIKIFKKKTKSLNQISAIFSCLPKYIINNSVENKLRKIKEKVPARWGAGRATASAGGHRQAREKIGLHLNLIDGGPK